MHQLEIEGNASLPRVLETQETEELGYGIESEKKIESTREGRGGVHKHCIREDKNLSGSLKTSIQVYCP